MLARRVTSAVILASFLALAVLSFLGDRVLSGIFIVVAGGVLGHHALALCGRCGNVACAFNPLTRGCGALPPEEPFSDLPITRTTVVPLLLSGPLAVIAAWRYSPVLTIAVAAVALTAHSVFREQTCKRCGNACLGNCNEHYREWKRART